MPPVRRKVRALRGLLEPELEGALILGPSPRAWARGRLTLEMLREAYAEHHEQIDALDSVARVPASRAWAFWEFAPAVPPELRDGSPLDHHAQRLARAGWLAATGRLHMWELGKLRSLAADGETETWHPWRDVLLAVLAARPELSRPTDPPSKAPRKSRRSRPKPPVGAPTTEGDTTP
ncbi:MAG: hypothetical protein ABSB75_02230 [Candidatus Limnocylindrales bacterium]